MIDFPASPTVGQIFTSAGCSWKWTGTYWQSNTAGGGGSSITVGDTPPVGAPGMTWWDSTDGQLYIWYDDPSADPGQWVPATNLGSTAVTNTGDVGRNLLHNSLFNIAQRGTAFFNVSGYTLDRWRLDFALDVSGVQQFPLGDGQRGQIGDEAASNGMYVQVAGNAGAGAFTVVSQYIEDVRRLAGKTVTVSFWAYTPTGSGRIGVAAQQIFGTGGSPSAGVLINGTPTPVLTTTATRYSVTFAFPSVAGKTLGTNNDSYSRLALFGSSGATNATFAGVGVQTANFVLWGVQLEIGSVMTPLEKPDPQQDLAKCQRFYALVDIFTSGYFSVATASFGVSAGLPVTMRATPTIGIVNNTGSANINPINVYNFANRGMIATTSCVAVGSATLQGAFTASADL